MTHLQTCNKTRPCVVKFRNSKFLTAMHQDWIEADEAAISNMWQTTPNTLNCCHVKLMVCKLIDVTTAFQLLPGMQGILAGPKGLNIPCWIFQSTGFTPAASTFTSTCSFPGVGTGTSACCSCIRVEISGRNQTCLWNLGQRPTSISSWLTSKTLSEWRIRADPLVLSMWACTGNHGGRAAVISSGPTEGCCVPRKMHFFRGPRRAVEMISLLILVVAR